MPGAGSLREGLFCLETPRGLQHAREDARLTAEIQQSFLEHRQLSGSPRIHAALQARGMHCSRKRIVRLMQQLGISAAVKRLRKPTTKSDA
ncbi:MAG: transposase [Ktedonobacteraceae bacterium]|nr:transposase [Ktedonobacteraceae bacterium]